MDMKAARWMVAGFLVVALIGYLAGRNPADLGQGAVPFSGEVVNLESEAGCDPVGGQCSAAGPGGGMTVRFSDEVVPLKPFEVEVRPAAGAEIEPGRAMIEFDMVGMDMGVNRFRLERRADGSWGSQVIIPVCTTGRTDWVAKVSLTGRETMWVAEFPFEAASRQP